MRPQICVLLIGTIANAFGKSEDGFLVTEGAGFRNKETVLQNREQHQEEEGKREGSLQCPSDNVIEARYRCKVGSHWEDCTRQSCCPGYTLLLGQCMSADTDPCSLGLCPQKCSVFLGRVVCTCFSGYTFDGEAHRRGEDQVCKDMDECMEEDIRSECSHLCTNTPGSYHCSCRDGFTLSPADNSTCTAHALEARRPPPSSAMACTANCHTVKRLKSTVATLEERVRSLSTALKLYTVTAGAPGPAGAVGPEGPRGPRGFPGPTGRGVREAEANRMQSDSEYRSPDEILDEDDHDDSSSANEDFDSYKLVKNNNKKSFCRCKRGRVGPPGATGRDGPRGIPGSQGVKGEAGEPGSFDFLMLMLTDIRHDLEALKSRVYPSHETPPTYNVKQHLMWERRMQQVWDASAAKAQKKKEEVARLRQDEEEEVGNF